jgi:hypothetical protein
MKKISLLCFGLLWFSVLLFGESTEDTNRGLESTTLPPKITSNRIETVSHTSNSKTVPDKKSFTLPETKPKVSKLPVSRLVILPLTGINTTEGDHIALILSNLSEIKNAFIVSVPPTSDVHTAMIEAQANMNASSLMISQRSRNNSVMTRAPLALTDTDLISTIGKRFNADFVITGYIKELGSRRLLLLSLIKVDNAQQVAGDYRSFEEIEELRTVLPGIATKFVNATKVDTSQTPSLAVVPFTLPEEDFDIHEAELLVQLLIIEITNSGKYTVFPRTRTIESTLASMTSSPAAILDMRSIKAVGRVTKAQYILVGNILRVREPSHLFLTHIFNSETGTIRAEGEIQYRTILDGMQLIPGITFNLIRERQNVQPFAY